MLALSRSRAASRAAANSGSRSVLLDAADAEGAGVVAVFWDEEAACAVVKVLSSTVANRLVDEKLVAVAALALVVEGGGGTTHDETELTDRRERRSVSESRSIMNVSSSRVGNI
jgi:hypothetical protein